MDEEPKSDAADPIHWEHPGETSDADDPPIPPWLLELEHDDPELASLPEPDGPPAKRGRAKRRRSEDPKDPKPEAPAAANGQVDGVGDPVDHEDDLDIDAKDDTLADTDHDAEDADADAELPGDDQPDDADPETWAVDGEHWDDDDWETEEATFASTLLGSRPARIMTIVAVATIVILLMSTVLLWQRVEDVKADVSTVPAEPVGNAELTELRRRLARLETQVASTLDDSGNAVGANDELRAELTALRQCVSQFQQQLAKGSSRTAFVYC